MVARKGKHVLQVTTKAGVLTYKDKPPYDDPMDGVHYTFCDRKEGYILVQHNETSLSGKLINEATGVVTNGGQSVIFSDDRRAYFADEQQDGRDGSDWTIYTADGKKSWSGVSVLESGKPAAMYAFLEAPTWLPSGELAATAYCINEESRKWQVKLVKKNNTWDWTPRKQCPK